MPAHEDRRIQALRARYASPARRHHGQAHVDALLRLLAEIASQVHDPGALELAIWYHDAEDPTVAGAERRSAERFRAEWNGLIDPATLDRAATFILATEAHRVPEGLTPEAAADCALFLDMDLAVLGADKADFDRYERQVREENLQHSDAAFAAARSRILEGILSRDRIYLSDHFHARFESQAKANLERSIAALKSRLAALQPRKSRKTHA